MDPEVNDLKVAPASPEEIVKQESGIHEGLVLVLTRIFIAFGGIIPFIPQYYQIYNTQDASGFSTHVCMIVVVSNVLRIAYWFGHWFDHALLLQSILMIIAMLLLVELCLRVERRRAEADGTQYEESDFSDFNFDKFWKWTNLMSYVEATLVLLSLTTLYTTVFRNYELLIEPVGFLALMIESTLSIPQILKNHENKSTQGMNVYMIILWTIGDTIKGIFFFRTNQPLPFKLCAVTQLLLEFVIFYQVIMYNNPSLP